MNEDEKKDEYWPDWWIRMKRRLHIGRIDEWGWKLGWILAGLMNEDEKKAAYCRIDEWGWKLGWILAGLMNEDEKKAAYWPDWWMRMKTRMNIGRIDEWGCISQWLNNEKAETNEWWMKYKFVFSKLLKFMFWKFLTLIINLDTLYYKSTNKE